MTQMNSRAPVTIDGHRKIDYWYPTSKSSSSRQARLKPLSRVSSWTCCVSDEAAEAVLAANPTWNRRGLKIDYGTYTDQCSGPDAEMGRTLGAALPRLGLGRGCWAVESQSSILRGAGAEFHVDEDFGDPVTLFCILSVAGCGDFVMPNIGVRIPFTRGTAILFDPMELHGITMTGQARAGKAPFICMTRDVSLTMSAAERLGLVGEHSGVRFDSLSLCRTSGELKRKRLASNKRDSN